MTSVLWWTAWRFAARPERPAAYMFDHLDIYTPSERWAVGLADAGPAIC